MVCIVQCVEEIFVEWVDVGESWEAVEDGLEFLAERFGCELDLASVEACIC